MKIDVKKFIATGEITEVDRQIREWQKALSQRKYDIEILKRLSKRPATTCGDCEWGRFHPCQRKDWDFDLKRTDPSCEDFEEWGIVW